MNHRLQVLGVRLCAVYIGFWGLLPFISVMYASIISVRDSQVFAPSSVGLLAITLPGLILTAISYGLWRLAEIGRQLSTVILVLQLAAVLFFLMGNKSPTSVGLVVAASISLRALVGLAYLNHPTVKGLFERG